ncbi:P-loop containing nucleoside triphosphate hydrolase protein [Punctularia strigosozonata HHB-11173 SS5]|uniref:P-loop containing nucleoside triphosphate hydrolase protein n=1 Tax=Punctularia strigosozonata (strain HHB-11173) TaxID=741275 RepID=UPI000441864D|nr:P-loop containing nucleoside triphosphate hydrolase protein [Punctularia strigosozonata HHB-11173 SS5]EIN05511.1 P-loop containing nucleoside triphosphate hydrolase protein [Punctularia strigosozonata HHB-11173 SS5]
MTWTRLQHRLFTTSVWLRHENPLGLPRKSAGPGAPQIPRRGGPIQKRAIPHVRKVVVVASGKGGVGKSTLAVNLAMALALHRPSTQQARLRVGILDLDIFGPSVPKLMGLERSEEPHLTAGGALIPMVNHGLACMSMGFLLPRSPSGDTSEDTAIVWRGLMVQKAVQQLLFDVDWRADAGNEAHTHGPGLDVLVVDMPPGTGDVPLTLGQLVQVDGSVIVSTPQDVALSDVRKGIAMFRKVSVPVAGVVLNQSHFICPSCSTHHPLFGSPEHFRQTVLGLGIPVLGEFPLVPGVSTSGDAGIPFELAHSASNEPGAKEWKGIMANVAGDVLRWIGL